jgi:hypothetical protein
MGGVSHPKKWDYGKKTRIDLNQSYQVAYWQGGAQRGGARGGGPGAEGRRVSPVQGRPLTG